MNRTLLKRVLWTVALLPRNACVVVLRAYRAVISPLYGNVWTNATLGALLPKAREVKGTADESFLRSALTGWHEARRDYDVAAVGWDQERWPFDLRTHGESRVGTGAAGPWCAALRVAVCGVATERRAALRSSTVRAERVPSEASEKFTKS